MSDSERKKRYYYKNREKILDRIKQKKKERERLANYGSSVLRLETFAQRIRDTAKSLPYEKLLLGVLSLCCTAFLIKESTKSFQLMEGEGALFKATLCEIVIVAICYFGAGRQSGRTLRFSILLVANLIAVLLAFGGPVNEFSMASRGERARQAKLADLRQNLQSKKIILTRYISAYRITAGRKIEKEISEITRKIGELESEATSTISSQVLLFNVVVSFLVRLVVMGANMFFSSMLGQLARAPRNADQSMTGLQLVNV